MISRPLWTRLTKSKSSPKSTQSKQKASLAGRLFLLGAEHLVIG